MTSVFCFGGIRFIIHSDFEIDWIPEERIFLCDDSTPQLPEQHYYITRYQEEPALPDAPLLYEERALKIYQGSEGEIRIHYLYGTEISMYCEEKKDGIYIQVLPVISVDAQMYLFALMMEKVLLLQGGLILHCAYLKTSRGAVLFTAPSETGKSTQADLWMEHRSGCEIVNGDRAILRKIDGVWTACGLPLCGSSKISKNISTPIRAVVYLEQAPVDQAERLPLMEAYRRVLEQVSVNFWNEIDAEKATALLVDVIGTLPVYLLKCTPSASAVDVLEQIFEKEGV